MGGGGVSLTFEGTGAGWEVSFPTSLPSLIYAPFILKQKGDFQKWDVY